MERLVQTEDEEEKKKNPAKVKAGWEFLQEFEFTLPGMP